MKDMYTLSKTEEGLYISSLTSGDAYNVANAINLGKNVKLEQIQNAIEKIFEAHPYLWTVLSVSDEGIVQKHIVKNKIEVEYEEVDKIDIKLKPFEIVGKPLYRFKVFKCKGESLPSLV